MPRLNTRAFEILRKETRKHTQDNSLSQIEQKLVLEELEKLRSQPGSPASLEELRKLVITTYPQFSEKTLSAAVKANRSSGLWGKVKFVIALVVFLPVGAVGVLLALGIFLSSVETTSGTENASSSSQLTPVLSMDEHYQQASTLLEQAEQAIEQATTSTDLSLSEEKLNAAKKHLDELPVSRTVSTPQYSYRTSRSGRIRRRFVGSSFQDVPDERFEEIHSRFEQVQSQLSEQKQAQKRNNTLIIGAKQFAFAAAKTGQNAPHSATKWEQVANLWKQAINQLEDIQPTEFGYLEAQKLLATYQTDLGTVRVRQQAEQASVEALEQGQRQINDLLVSTSSNNASGDRNYTLRQLQTIIYQLKKVQSGTTAYPEAQNLLLSAQNKLNQLQPQ